MVVVKGKVELDEETVRMMASEVLPIEAMRQKMSRELSIKLTSPPHGRQTFEALADLFARHRGDRRVVLELELRDQHPPLRLRAPLAAAVRVRPPISWPRKSSASAAPGRWCFDSNAQRQTQDRSDASVCLCGETNDGY